MTDSKTLEYRADQIAAEAERRLDKMADSKTATERLRELLDAQGIEWRSGRNHANYTSWDAGEWRVSAEELADGSLLMRGYSTAHLTPEQAIAATLGSKPDEIELTQTYDAGFKNGVMAVFQQLEGIEDYEGLQDFIAEYWAEGEGNDEP